MKEKSYTILEQGTKEDGRSWARYIDDVGEECHIRVRAGLDLEESIQDSVDREREYREKIAAMPPEELAELREIGRKAGRRWQRLSDWSSWAHIASVFESELKKRRTPSN